MSHLLVQLHDKSPYEGFDAEEYQSDLQGWGSDDPIFEAVIAALRPNFIVEVGSWKGASAIHMGNIVRRLGLATQIICVDTWLGSPEHYLEGGGTWRPSLAARHGFPQLYYTFLANVVRAGLQDVIIPLPMTSENAAVVLASKGIRADLAYIDAAHEEESALRDFRAYWDLLTPDGVLLGDDYISWEGVTRAANRFAHEVQRPLIGKWSKFAISRSDRVSPTIAFNTGWCPTGEVPR